MKHSSSISAPSCGTSLASCKEATFVIRRFEKTQNPEKNRSRPAKDGSRKKATVEWGTPAAREKYVRDLVQGKKLGCTCFSEPNAESDLSSIETCIENRGDRFEINGAKTWISNGTVADTAIVYGSFDGNLKHRGLCAIVVETNQPGWEARETPKLGDKSSPIAEIHMDNVRALKENLLGRWGEGFTVAMTALDRGRISVGSGAVGLAQTCWRPR